MNFIKNFNFKNQLDKFLVHEEDGGGAEGGSASGPNTVAAAGLPTSGDDAFKGATYSNLEGATTGYYYDFSKKKKKKRKLKKSFLDYMLPSGKASSFVKEEKSFTVDFAMNINKEELSKLFGESIYEFGENKYTVKFYRKGENYRFGKMFFVGNNGFCMRFNKAKNSKNKIDSISFWNKWSTEIINQDLNFSITPDADVITDGLSLEKCFEVAKQIFKNRKPRFVKIENIRIEKRGKVANKEFEKELGESGKKSISFTELLDFALNNGYTVKEPSDGSLDINLIVPMKIPNKEYVMPHHNEYKKTMDVEKFVDDGKLLLTPVNVQNFVSNAQHAEEILEFIRSLFKDNLINNLSFEAIVFASKVRKSNHPNWLKLLVPKM
jgi:hypothetical protein